MRTCNIWTFQAKVDERLFSSVSDDFDDDEKSFKMSEIVQFVGIQNLKLRNLQPKGKNNICKLPLKKFTSVEPDWQKVLLEVRRAWMSVQVGHSNSVL